MFIYYLFTVYPPPERFVNKKRKTPVNYENHEYKDYLIFKENNPEVPTTEMDTVLNSQFGPYI